MATVGPQGEQGARGQTGQPGARGAAGRWRVSLAISFLALVVAFGSNITTYKLSTERTNDLSRNAARACVARTENRKAIRTLAEAALPAIPPTSPERIALRAALKKIIALPPVVCD